MASRAIESSPPADRVGLRLSYCRRPTRCHRRGRLLHVRDLVGHPLRSSSELTSQGPPILSERTSPRQPQRNSTSFPFAESCASRPARIPPGNACRGLEEGDRANCCRSDILSSLVSLANAEDIALFGKTLLLSLGNRPAPAKPDPPEPQREGWPGRGFASRWGPANRICYDVVNTADGRTIRMEQSRHAHPMGEGDDARDAVRAPEVTCAVRRRAR